MTIYAQYRNSASRLSQGDDRLTDPVIDDLETPIDIDVRNCVRDVLNGRTCQLVIGKRDETVDRSIYRDFTPDDIYRNELRARV